MLLTPLTDYPERFYDMKRLVLEKEGRLSQTLKVTSITPYEGKGKFFLKADGIADMETAEKFKGWTVTVSKDERVPLPENEYWIDDIIGLTVVEYGSGRELGTVEEVMATGSNDVYLVRTLDGKLEPIPAIPSAVRSVDVAGGTISVTIPEGLWN